MTYPDPNPPIPPLVYWTVIFGVLVVATAGIGLFFFPGRLGPLWPWALTPFNTRFLGAIYLAALVAITGLAAVGRRSPARLVLPLVLCLTAVILAVSLVYRERFTQNPATVVFWFVIYVVVPTVAVYGLWRERAYLLPRETTSLPPSLIWLLRLQVIVLGGYGVLLLALPGPSGAFWPWPLDDFHARLYSTAFLVPALGAWLLLRRVTRLELGLLGLAQVIGGACMVTGLVVVDAAIQRVDWSAAGTWGWIGLFCGGLLIGALMLWQAIRGMRHPPLPTEAATGV